MQMKSFFVGVVFLTGCATTYQDAVRSTYIGNGEYEIRSNGNDSTHEDTIRDYLYRHAFEICAKEGKGYKIVGPAESTTKQRTDLIPIYGSSPVLLNVTLPGARTRVICEGEVDQKLAEKFRTPASK